MYTTCLTGNMEEVELLIHKGVHDWDRGLRGACEGGHMKLAEFMICKGAIHWNYGLYGACWGGHMEIAELMIQKGANDWNLGLGGACWGGHMKIAELMIRKGAIPNMDFPSKFIPYMLNRDIQASVFGVIRTHEFITRRHNDQVAIADTLTHLLPADVIKHILVLYIPFRVQ